MAIFVQNGTAAPAGAPVRHSQTKSRRPIMWGVFYLDHMVTMHKYDIRN